jgi:hypothetical protein
MCASRSLPALVITIDDPTASVIVVASRRAPPPMLAVPSALHAQLATGPFATIRCV